MAILNNQIVLFFLPADPKITAGHVRTAICGPPVSPSALAGPLGGDGPSGVQSPGKPWKPNCGGQGFTSHT
jgi:hypothetical protein